MKKIALLALSAAVLSAETIDLGDVTVTATRSETKSTEVQASVLKAVKENVETTVYKKDLLNNIAGVYVTQTTSGLGHMLSMRTPITTNARFLYLQDGIPVQSSGFFNHNALAYTNFSSAGGVEVLKGAGTALYGSDAIAGTLNVQTPSAKDFTGTAIQADGGSFGYGSLTVKKADKTKDGSYFISGTQTHKDGWKEHSAFDRSEVTIRKDKLINYNNSLNTTFVANSSVAEQTGDLKVGDYRTDASVLGQLDLSQVDAKRKFDFARLSAQWTNLSYDKVEIDTIFYARFNRNQYTATWKKWDPHNDSKQASLGIMNKTKFDKSWGELTVGLDTEYTQATQLTEQQFDYNASIPQGTIYDYNVDYLALAPYVHTKVNLSKKFKATAGLRFDYGRFDYANNTADGQYEASTYQRVGDRSDSFTHLSPKLSVAYNATDDMSAYLRYANGFRIPSASRLYQLTTSNTSFNLDPETTDTYELGYKQKSKNYNFQAALYYMNIDDTIVAAADGLTYINSGTTHHYGLETTLRNKYSETWSTNLSHAYSRHKFDKDATSNAGNDMQAAPRTTATAQLIMQPKAISGLKVMAELQSMSSYYMDESW